MELLLLLFIKDRINYHLKATGFLGYNFKISENRKAEIC